jgi:hypothetical protein
MNLHETALLNILATHLELTVALTEDHIALCRRTTGDYDPKLNDMLAHTRSSMQRIREVLNQSK